MDHLVPKKIDKIYKITIISTKEYLQHLRQVDKHWCWRPAGVFPATDLYPLSALGSAVAGNLKQLLNRQFKIYTMYNLYELIFKPYKMAGNL